MDIVIAGSTGLIGTALVRRFMDQGHRVRRLVRPDTLTNPNRAPLGTTIDWNPEAGTIDLKQLEGCDAVINLAGENVFGLWTTNKKYRIVDSRVHTTRTLARELPKLITPPKVWLNASATGYYGNRGEQTLDESSTSGGGFLAETCRRWEAEMAPMTDPRIRTAMLRFGMVLSPRGGALKTMMPAFKLGLGGPVGDGDQYWAWISIEDVLGAIEFIIDHDQTSGIYNFVAPHPVTSREFAKTLGKALKRPAIFRMPETLAVAVGDGLATELILASQRAVPARLADAGYTFKHPELSTALKELAA